MMISFLQSLVSNGFLLLESTPPSSKVDDAPPKSERKKSFLLGEKSGTYLKPESTGKVHLTPVALHAALCLRKMECSAGTAENV